MLKETTLDEICEKVRRGQDMREMRHKRTWEEMLDERTHMERMCDIRAFLRSGNTGDLPQLKQEDVLQDHISSALFLRNNGWKYHQLSVKVDVSDYSWIIWGNEPFISERVCIIWTESLLYTQNKTPLLSLLFSYASRLFFFVSASAELIKLNTLLSLLLAYRWEAGQWWTRKPKSSCPVALWFLSMQTRLTRH